MWLLLLACAPENSCSRAVDAAEACVSSAGGDAAPYDSPSICGEWTSALESAWGAWYRCQADVWKASACATPEDIDVAVATADACVAD